MKQEFEKHLVKSESFRRIQTIVGLLKMQSSIKVIEKELDTDIYLFNIEGLTLNLITVTIPPEQRDKKLTEKLIAENSGILNWLIAGYAMWKKEDLEEPEAVRQANEEYRMDMDAVGTFVNDCLEIDASLKWRLHTKLLYETYIKWCNKNNERVMSQKWLGLVIRNEWRV